MKKSTKVNYTKLAIETLGLELNVHFSDYRDFNRVVTDQESFDRFIAKVNENGMENFASTYRECEQFEHEKRTKFGITHIRKNGVYTSFYGSGKDAERIGNEIYQENKILNQDNPKIDSSNQHFFNGGCTYFYETLEAMMKALNHKSTTPKVSIAPYGWSLVG